MWDVREAALKQYGEYLDKSTYIPLPTQAGDAARKNMGMEIEQDNFRGIGMEIEPVNPAQIIQQNGPPPLLLGGNNLAAGIEGNGAFVANDNIDDGVTLVAQLQHGAPVEENQQGRATRTSKKTIKVMCLARCPVGGHFATGSDDGLGRVWADDCDNHLEKLDLELNEFDSEDIIHPPPPNSVALRSQMKLVSGSGKPPSIIL